VKEKKSKGERREKRRRKKREVNVKGEKREG
jgi:hypothetical protein